MMAVGYYSNDSAVEQLKYFTPVDSALVERGDVYKKCIFKDNIGSIELLLVAPSSKITLHQHENDSEIYFDWYEGSAELCSKGDSHSLENSSDDCWLLVVAVKRIK